MVTLGVAEQLRVSVKCQKQGEMLENSCETLAENIVELKSMVDFTESPTFLKSTHLWMGTS